MSFVEEFQTPGPSYRAKPFWAWNGKLKRDELLRQIDVIKEMGFGGFFMHSRTGLATSYLGDEWFELINACADKAKERGMDAWLYDEDRWPSGTAGGEVTKNPAYRMHFMRMTEEEGGVPSYRFAVRLQDGLLKDYRPLGEGEGLEEGETPLFFSVEEMPCSSFYNGQTYVDTMNLEATKAFLESTHEKYVEKCGTRIGDSIQGIFTDEPHRGSLMTSFGQGVDAGERMIPWTGALPERFKKQYGVNLLERLPALFLKKDELPSKLKWQYVELLEELFLDHFARPIDAWCREHKMVLTGHVLHEDSLTAQTAMSGSMMRYYAQMELPGIDFLGEFGRCYFIAKQLQSVARQFDKKLCLSELDGCTGWQMSFESYKAVGDWQALYGINLRCPHLSWYTMEGQAKRDYPASIFEQSAWWKEYAYVEDYYARIARFAEDGQAQCGVLVISPLESVWARIHPGWCDGLSGKETRVRELDERYEQLFFLLQRAHIDFDYGDEGLLAESACVEGNLLRVGGARYSAILVSGLDTIRGTTVSLLREFSEQNGLLIVAGDPPKAVDCVLGEPSFQGLSVPFEEDALRNALKEYEVSLTYADGRPAKDVLCQVKRTAEGEQRFMLLNDNREEALEEVCLTVKGTGPVTRFIPETGLAQALPFTADGDTLRIPLHFDEKTMLLISVGKEYREAREPERFNSTASQAAEGPFAYELDEPNLCVLDTARVSIGGGQWSEELEILKADRLVRDAFRLPYRGGEMLQPWFVGQGEDPVKGNVSLKFSFEAEHMPEGPVRLVLEGAEHFTVSINGVALTAFVPGFFWADSCFSAMEIPVSLLREGQNEVVLRTRYRESSNLEAMYLTGGFGVRLEGPRRILTKLPDTLALGSIVGQGLPFYSGKLTYQVPVPKGTGRVFLEVSDFKGACVTVSGNKRQKTIAWKPYQAEVTGMAEGGVLNVTDVLTRRNTFGPLHQVPAIAYSYGPDSFESTGERFSDAYSLLDAGLLSPLVFRFGE